MPPDSGGNVYSVRAGVRRWYALRQSRQIDISGIRVVCLALGPYRNLSTLTGSILFLHPNCQVLNHAGVRIFGSRHVDFIAGYSPKRFDAFVRYAVQISGGGRRGKYGGSIVHSHAFAPGYPMAGVYAETHGAVLRKEQIRTLFWKEPLPTSNRIRDCGFDIDDVLAREQRLRFLMPVRNPMDCAVSSMRTGHSQFFASTRRRSPFAEVLSAVIDELAWFEDLRVRHPGRFLRFFEYDPAAVTLQRLARFLRLDMDSRWFAAAQKAFAISHGYEHPGSRVRLYRDLVTDRLAAHPELVTALLKFTEKQAHIEVL